MPSNAASGTGGWGTKAGLGTPKKPPPGTVTGTCATTCEFSLLRPPAVDVVFSTPEEPEIQHDTVTRVWNSTPSEGSNCGRLTVVLLPGAIIGAVAKWVITSARRELVDVARRASAKNG